MQSVFDTLVMINDDGGFVGRVALSWQNYENEIIFRIRNGIKFTNGDFLTIDDIIFSLDYFFSLPHNSFAYSYIDKYEKIDQNHIRFYKATNGDYILLRWNLIKKMLEKIRKYPFVRIIIATNGLLITDEIITYLENLPNKVLLQISLEGHDIETNDQIRGNKTFLSIIKSCIKVAKSSIKLQISHCITEINYNYLEDIIRLAIFIGADSMTMGIVMNMGRAIENHMSINNKDLKKIHDCLIYFRINYDRYINIWEILNSSHINLDELLNKPQDWLLIKPDGKVILDWAFPIIMGDLKTDSIEKAWSNLNKVIQSENVLKFLEKTGIDDLVFSEQLSRQIIDLT